MKTTATKIAIGLVFLAAIAGVLSLVGSLFGSAGVGVVALSPIVLFVAWAIGDIVRGESA